MEPQTFSKGAVRLALSCAAKDVGRYAMNAVLVEPGRLVATDGRRLVVVERPEAPQDKPAADATLLVPRDTLDTASKGAKVDTLSINGSVEQRDRRAQPMATYPVAPMEGKFPDWRCVMPKPRDMEGSITVRLSPTLLAGILAAMPDTVGGYVAIEIPKPSEEPRYLGQITKPVQITAETCDGDTVTAVLMPITTDKG